MYIKLEENNRLWSAKPFLYEEDNPDEWIDIADEECPEDIGMFPCNYRYVDGEFIRDTDEEIRSKMEEARRAIERSKPVLLQTQYITREDFNLLDAQDDHTLYYILEEDGTTTMLKGENV